jgi:hypothetical protein
VVVFCGVSVGASLDIGESSDESQLRDEVDEDELDAPSNGRRMDVTIKIP